MARTTTGLCSLWVLAVVAFPAPSPAQSAATPRAVIWRDADMGYTRQEVETYTQAMRKRIAELEAP